MTVLSIVLLALPGDLPPVPGPTPSVAVVAPPPVDKTGVGGLGFLIVMLLLAASVGLYFAMRGSLRRLRQSADAGAFGGSAPTAPPPPVDRVG